MSYQVEQVASDSWYYSSAAPSTRIDNTNIKMGYPSELGGRTAHGRIVFGAPGKKEILYNNVYLSLYINRLLLPVNYSWLDVNVQYPDLFDSKGGPEIVNNAYNDFRLRMSLINMKALFDKMFSEGFTLNGDGSTGYGAPDGEYFNTPSTRASSNKPKLKYNVNDIVPLVYSIAPQTKHIDERISQTFTWSFALPTNPTGSFATLAELQSTYPSGAAGFFFVTSTTHYYYWNGSAWIDGGPYQAIQGYVHQLPVEAGYEIQWRVYGSGTINTLSGSTLGYANIPAYTFPNGVPIEWRIRVKSDDNVFSEWSGWFLVSTIDIVPAIYNHSPQSGYIDERNQQVFSWSFALPVPPAGTYATYAELQAAHPSGAPGTFYLTADGLWYYWNGTAWTAGGSYQGIHGYQYRVPIEGGYELQWRVVGSGTTNTLIESTHGYAIIPPNTFPYGAQIEWRIRVETDDAIFSIWSEWFKLNTVDVVSAGAAQSPANTYLDAKKENVFRWQYQSLAGYPQGGFEAQVNYDLNPGWVALFSGDTTAQEYRLPANTLTGGTMRWRIRVKNSRGTWSSWSNELKNRVIAAPARPVISGVNGLTARPTIMWQTDRQMAFQVQILKNEAVIYDSGIVNTKASQFKIPVLLENGQYLIKVRVQDEYTLYSEWGFVNAFINAEKPPTISLSASSIPNGIRLHLADVDAAITQIYIYRGKANETATPIAAVPTSTKSWLDFSCMGQTKYFARGVSGDLFSDSAPVIERPQMFYSMIAPVSNLSKMIEFKYSSVPFSRDFSAAYGVTMLQFEGRKRPVAEFGDTSSKVMDFNAVLQKEEHLELLLEIAEMKETVLYRDKAGRKIYGILGSLRYVEGTKRTAVSISLEETDYNEVISIA
jgi:hypothetical protein